MDYKRCLFFITYPVLRSISPFFDRFSRFKLSENEHYKTGEWCVACVRAWIVLVEHLLDELRTILFTICHRTHYMILLKQTFLYNFKVILIVQLVLFWMFKLTQQCILVDGEMFFKF